MRVDGRWRYYRDPDVMAGPHAQPTSSTSTRSSRPTPSWSRRSSTGCGRPGHRTRRPPTSSRNATKAKALDLLRGLLPAATTSNLGMFASGQSYEMLLLRLRSSELAEARHLGDRLLAELRHLIPAFLTRVDRPDRGGVWSEYLATTRRETRALAVSCWARPTRRRRTWSR